ncbi:Histidine-specific methyltransferase EgtD [Mizuhopecten yessoensis]|uniref:Histidine-specific methyltransferase EgtD n=2 Tax=Mizuhopecten yessoensis TaxID=6573 RepID=A0A210R5S3_MIZYE|nr:Histidine-specific methyltransferase EgtD [Mizuhopecten yessoensis]
MGEDAKQALVKGLTSTPKYIPSWYSYDETGSELGFKCTVENPGYYFSRSETCTLQNYVQDIIPRVPYGLTLIDIGSGNCKKTKFVINELLQRQNGLSYYPVDISEEFLLKSVKDLSEEYDDSLVITPIPADYEKGIEQLKNMEGPKVILFFGCLISLSFEDQVNTLRMISTIMTAKCRLVFSADITQNREAVLKAYNDDAGFQQKFRQNGITRLNKEEGSQIDMDVFKYEADFIQNSSSKYMSYVTGYVTAKGAVLYPIPGLGIDLRMEKGERLYLHEGAGISCKYTLQQLQNIVEKAGLRLEETWTDEERHAVLCRCKIV